MRITHNALCCVQPEKELKHLKDAFHKENVNLLQVIMQVIC